MVACMALVMWDPVELLLPVTIPPLRPGVTTTWDPAVSGPDGPLRWTEAADAPRTARLADPANVWPQVEVALRDAGLPLPRREPHEALAGLRRQPTPPEDLALAAAATDRLMAILDRLPADAWMAVPASLENREPSFAPMAYHGLSQAITSLARREGLAAAGQLERLARLAAGLDSLDGLMLGYRAQAGARRLVLDSVAGNPGDAARHTAAQAFLATASGSLPPGDALRRSRLALLAWTVQIHQGVLTGMSASRRSRQPADINHALAQVNACFERAASVLPRELHDRTLVTAVDPAALLEVVMPDLEPPRRLAEQMLFPLSSAERMRLTGEALAVLPRLVATVSITTLVHEARRGLAAEAALTALLAGALPTGSPDAVAAALATRLPPAAGGVAFRPDGDGIAIELPIGTKTELLARIRLESRP